jgi:hypothetical protein
VIYTMASEIATRLVGRGFPIEARYEGERICSAVGVVGRRIDFERDKRVPDAFYPFPGGQRNPRATGVRGVAVVATIYGQSSKRGARAAEHQRDCDQLLDALLVELREWSVEARAGEPEIVSGRLLGPDDFTGVDMPQGAAYELHFRIPRAILRRDYIGDAEPTGTIASSAVFSPVRVSLDGQTYEEVE